LIKYGKLFLNEYLVTTKSICTTAYQDIISGRATRYDRQNDERIRQLREAQGEAVALSLYSYVPETIFLQDANHPFGTVDAMSRMISGEVKRLSYIETGPPAARKEGF